MTALPDPRQQPTLTAEQAATVLGLGRSATYDAIARGEIPSIRLGGRVVVPTAQLLAMLGHRQPDVDIADRLRVLVDLGDDIEQAATEADAAVNRLRETVAAARAVVKSQLRTGPTAIGPAAT